MIPIPPHPQVRLLSGLSLWLAVAVPTISGRISLSSWPQPVLTDDDDVMFVSQVLNVWEAI